MDSTFPYHGGLTREHFLFYEMRTTAKLMADGLSDQEIISRVYSENLYQYPTERTLKSVATACVKRLHALDSPDSVQAIASQPSEIAKQICLYAMMRQNRLVWEFMLTVIGEKYRLQDYSFGKIDLNTYFMRLQEQDDTVASWSESTITKLKQVLTRVLVENEYLDNFKSTRLNPVWLQPLLEEAIRKNGDEIALPAFNCFS